MDKPARGMHFEDFAVGQSFESPGRTITEADIVWFAGLSGDYNTLHTDAEAAKASLFGGRVAHGLLVLSVASGLATRLGLMEGTVMAFMGLEWKFRAPVRAGDTVRVLLTVREMKLVKRLGGGVVTLDVEIRNQEGTVAQKGDWRLLMRSRELSGGSA